MIEADILVRGASEVVTCDPTFGEVVGRMPDGAVAISGERIVWIGPEADVGKTIASRSARELNVEGRSIIPGFVDAHTHLVFAGSRREEFAARAKGQEYSAGGILTTVEATRRATAAELLDLARTRADRMLVHGTTTAEAKSGYALNEEGELKLLQVLTSLNESHQIDLEVTYMAAHVVPPEFENKSDHYVQLVCDWLSVAAPIANWCDVFCDLGAFSAEQAWLILEAGKRAGLKPRIHANELGPSGGVEVAASVGAASADHLLYLDRSQARELGKRSVVGVVCPTTALGLGRVPAMRMMLEEGMTVAIASDLNPGTAFAENIQFAIAIATRTMGIGPDEALLAATASGAAALQRNDIGRVVPGCLADLIVLESDSYLDLGYHAGVNLAARVMKRGAWVGEAA